MASKSKILHKRKKRHQNKQVMNNPDKRVKRPHKRIAGRSGQIRSKQLQGQPRLD